MKEESTAKSSSSLEETEVKEKQSASKQKNIKNKSEFHTWNKKTFVYLMMGALLLACLSSFPYLIPKAKDKAKLERKWYPIQNSQSIKFETFIVPFRRQGQFTYISLSISFEVPNKELMHEIIEKKEQIRGIIYNVLSNNLNILENVSSLMKLKSYIINGVNGVLTAGKVNEAIIMDFSTV